MCCNKKVKTIDYKNGNRYEGETTKDGKFQGHGKYFYYNGDRYEGQFKDSQFNGAGKYFFKHSGNRYEGAFKDDKFNGQGKLLNSKNQVLYEGEWRNDMIWYGDRFEQVASRYEMLSPKYRNKLHTLKHFKVVFLLDDSGSMASELAESPLKKSPEQRVLRWDELRYYSEIGFDVASSFDASGTCDVYFLNRGTFKGVKSAQQLRGYFEALPENTHLTPLKTRFNDILNDNKNLAGKNLLVVIVTDGEPSEGSDPIGEFRQCLQAKPHDKCFVSIVACTDDNASVSYLENWDKTIKNVDVVDDYRSEREKLRARSGAEAQFTFGDYVVKSLMGSIYPDMDKQGERR